MRDQDGARGKDDESPLRNVEAEVFDEFVLEMGILEKLHNLDNSQKAENLGLVSGPIPVIRI